MKQIGVAVVGCGYVAASHLAAWRRIPYAEVVAVCDNNKGAADKFAKDWKIPRKFDSVSAMSDYRPVTLWDICTPIDTHKDLANQGMKDGFDVLIEKPLTLTSKEAMEIVQCQRLTGMRAGAIHNWLFEPPIIKAKALVDRGRIGKPISAYMSILHTRDEPMSANKNHWSHKLPGGRFSEMLIHPIYLLRRFLGDIKVADVLVSKVGNYDWMKYDELLVSFKTDKAPAGAYVSFNAPRNSINLDIFGSEGIIRLDIVSATLTVLPPSKMRRFDKALDSISQSVQLSTSTLKNAFNVLSGQWLDGHEKCIRLFAESLVKNTEPPVTIQEGFEVVKVLEEAYKRIEAS